MSTEQVGIEIIGKDSFSNVVKGMGQATQQSFQTITMSAKGVVTETKNVQNVMGATVTTINKTSQGIGGFTNALKSNILSISIAASSILGLVQQYTQLQRARIMMERAGVAEARAAQTVIDKTQALETAIARYGQGSAEAADAANKLRIAQDAAGIATERHALLQEQFNERVADFAINILPNMIGAFGSITQVIQGFSAAHKAAAATTTITGDAAAVAAAKATLLAGAEGAAGTAATTMGMKMKAALIGTGIGAILVAIGTALVAFTQNWWHFRDAVNAAGAELGKFAPILTPLLNMMTQFGNWILRIFGEQVPTAMTAGTTQATTAVQGMSKETVKALEEVDKAWDQTMKDLLVMPNAKHKEWKEQYKKLEDLGFSKSGIHELKNKIFKPAALATAVTDNIKEAFQILGQAGGAGVKIGGETWRELSNNIIDQINEAMRKAGAKKGKGGKLGFMEGLKDLIRAHKKDPELPQLIAEWFEGLSPDLQKRLQLYRINVDEIVSWLGFEPAAIKAGLEEKLKQAMTLNLTDIWSGATGGMEGKGMPLDLTDIWGGATGTAAKPKGWLAALIEQVTKAFSPENLAGAADALMSGVLTVGTDVATKVKNWLAGVFTLDNFNAAITALKGVGTTITNALMALITDPIGTATALGTWLGNVVTSIGAWFSGTFPKTTAKLQEIGGVIWGAISAGWEALDSAVVEPVIKWLFSSLSEKVEFFKSLGASIWATIQLGWEAVKDVGGKIATWIQGQLDKAPAAIMALGPIIWNKILEGWTIIKGEGSKIAAWLKAQVDAAWEDIKAIGPMIWNQIVAGMSVQASSSGMGAWFATLQGGFQGAEGASGTNDKDKNKNKNPQGLGDLVNWNWQTQAEPVAKLNIEEAVKNIDRLIGDFAGWLSYAATEAVAKLTITDAVKNITRLIGDFAGYLGQVEGNNPQVQIDITGAVKLISRLIDDFYGYVQAVKKEKPKVQIDITGAVKSITRLIGDLQGIPNITRTVTIQEKRVKVAEGGIFGMAGGGISTKGSTQTTGPYEWAERGNETLAFIPSYNPDPYVSMINAMYGKKGNTADDLARILANLRIPVHVHFHTPMREIVEEVEINLGQNVRTY